VVYSLTNGNSNIDVENRSRLFRAGGRVRELGHWILDNVSFGRDYGLRVTFKLTALGGPVLFFPTPTYPDRKFSLFPFPHLHVRQQDHLTIRLAKNRGGACKPTMSFWPILKKTKKKKKKKNKKKTKKCRTIIQGRQLFRAAFFSPTGRLPREGMEKRREKECNIMKYTLGSGWEREFFSPRLCREWTQD